MQEWYRARVSREKDDDVETENLGQYYIPTRLSTKKRRNERTGASVLREINFNFKLRLEPIPGWLALLPSLPYCYILLRKGKTEKEEGAESRGLSLFEDGVDKFSRSFVYCKRVHCYNDLSCALVRYHTSIIIIFL